MADYDDELEGPFDDQGDEEDGEQGQDPEEHEEGVDTLADDIVRKWDPQRLLGVVSKRGGHGRRLDLATRSRYERRLGADLGDVRVYTGELAEEVTRAHQADAVTIGSTGMIMMSSQADSAAITTEGRALLAHELTHVAQAKRGVHRRAAFGEATPLATEEHEAEADASEQAERQESSGGEADDGKTDSEREQELHERLRQRVLEMFAEAERAHLWRNGPGKWRP